MSAFLRILRRFIGVPKQPGKVSLEASAVNLSKFAEGDRVLIDRKKLSGPLDRGQRHDTPHGFIVHNDIIGKPAARASAKTSTGHTFEIAYPTLDEFVALAPRKVTPIYALYASLIVSLLDIHVSPPAPGSSFSAATPALEILESGTGHGSLTLHLARAIAAANPPPPSSLPRNPTRRQIQKFSPPGPNGANPDTPSSTPSRQGIYWPHIDFHAMDVGDWVSSQLSTRPKEEAESGFLQYVVLDMPGIYKKISIVIPVMKDNAVLAIFVPSVTQIGDCVREIEKHELPLVMDKVVELGEGISNGRIWDVRLVKIRNNGPDRPEEVVNAEGEKDAETAAVERSADGGSVFVCRPKVGKLTIGGGFVGMWRKVDPASVPTTEKQFGKPHKNVRTNARKIRDNPTRRDGKETTG